IINKLEKYLVTFNDDSLGINIFDTKLILGYTQIDLVDLYKSLLPLKNKNISFSDFSFIERDMDYSKSNGYVWSVYSIDNRKEI
ncbi:hypothetical protein ACLBVH_32960, partial [Pseudomonas aeruginosa]|uniref:hypothetical protein n=1 Tax=Pseudomonas aeruginosa TaxID=287 RepID=UPI003968D50F